MLIIHMLVLQRSMLKPHDCSPTIYANCPNDISPTIYANCPHALGHRKRKVGRLQVQRRRRIFKEDRLQSAKEHFIDRRSRHPKVNRRRNIPFVPESRLQF